MPKTRIGVLLSSFLTLTVCLTLSALPARAQYLTIDVPNATETDCNDINTADVVVGFFVDSAAVDHGFALINKKFTTVDIPGSTATLHYGVNNKGQAKIIESFLFVLIIIRLSNGSSIKAQAVSQY